MGKITADQVEKIENVAKDTLRDLTAAARSLRDAVEDVQRDVNRAMERLNDGDMPEGVHNFGVLGHQAPFEITKRSAKLTEIIVRARAMKYIGLLTDEQIDEAYAQGAKGLGR